MANQYSSELTEQRAIAEKLLRRGHATVSELAAHFGLARQTVQRWADGIDVSAARAAHVAHLVEKARRNH
jgi:transposase